MDTIDNLRLSIGVELARSGAPELVHKRIIGHLSAPLFRQRVLDLFLTEEERAEEERAASRGFYCVDVDEGTYHMAKARDWLMKLEELEDLAYECSNVVLRLSERVAALLKHHADVLSADVLSAARLSGFTIKP
jgi:hypothetical protein